MSSTATIRRARREDRDAVEALWLALHAEQHEIDSRFELADDAARRWRNDFPGWLRSASRWMWVAEKEGRLVGFLTAERHYLAPIYRAASELFLTEIFVVPGERKQGIGRKLVGEALNLATRESIDRIRLIALSANETSIRFWESFGARSFTETMLLPVAENAGGMQVKATKLGF